MKARFRFVRHPKGIHHILHKLTKTARLVYDTMELKIGPSGWTTVVDTAWLRRETGLSSVSISRAKRELLDKGIIRQKPYRINGKPVRGSFQFFMIPTAKANELMLKEDNTDGDS